MKQKKCENCGRLYPEDAITCPGCNAKNSTFVEVKTETPTNNTEEVEKSLWDTFANVLMLVGGISVVIALGISLWNESNLVFYAIGGYVSLLWMCGILKLLVKVERNTRK